MTPSEVTQESSDELTDQAFSTDQHELTSWHERPHQAPAALDLVTDHSRPLNPSGRRGLVSLTLAPELGAALAELGAAEQLAPPVALLGISLALLARYSGREQFAVGLPVAGEGAALDLIGRSGVMGYSMLAVDLGGDPSLPGLLRRTRAALALPASSHTTMPNGLRGDATTPSPFQVLVASASADDRSGVARWLAEGGLDAAPADLAMVFEARGAELVASIGYDADLFERATVEGMAGHLVMLLTAALAAPTRPVLALPLVSAAEREQLAAWNQTEADLPLACLHRLVAAHAATTPTAPALLFDGGSLSYGELEVRANQLAHYLRRRGVGPERIVGVYMARGPELIVALLGILKAGGAYLPLDPAYPAARLADMIADAGPVALLCDAALPAGLLAALDDADALPVIDLAVEAGQIGGQPAEPPPELAELANLAYVIYTSGSTGRPKGVLIEHRTAATYVLGAGLHYGIAGADRGLHFSTVSFDSSVDEIFVPLAHGAGLVVTSGYSPPDFTAMHELIVRHGISLVCIPTAYWHTWIAELDDGRLALPDSLRLVIIGGEAASGERYNRWRALVPPTVRLFNGYGPTETSVGSMWYVPSPYADEPPGPMAIGRAMPNEQVYLLDRQQRPVPIGAQGELYIGGDGVARGYHNRPDLNAERFVTLELAEGEAPVRLYRTGDLARWRRDGVLLYDGRADQQVKVRGYRIEPGEIEAALRRHEAVSAAAVATHPDASGELSLVGYVALRRPVELEALRAFLDEQLPHYMVPAALLVLDALPLTPSGKVDRRGLPAPVTPAQAPLADDQRARTGVEQALTTIWEELFGWRGIGVNTSFFALGGHSLLAMRMLGRVDSELGVRLPVSIMIHHTTIAELARAIEQADHGTSWSVVVPIQPAGDRPPLFCVHGITGDVLWFDELGRCLAPDQPLYGLQARGLAPGEPQATTIEQMAAWYIEGMRRVQPRGPYFIAGASFGSVIALEIARQLEAAGEELGMLASFDYDPYQSPAGAGGGLGRAATLVRSAVHLVRNELGPMAWAERKAWARWRLRLRLKGLVALLLGGAKLPTDAADILPYGQELPLHRRELLLANDVAYERYTPGPYGGRITLFALDGFYTGAAAATGSSGWERIAEGGVEVVVMSGSHETMFKQPHVAGLAARLRQLIDAAVSARPG